MQHMTSEPPHLLLTNERERSSNLSIRKRTGREGGRDGGKGGRGREWEGGARATDRGWMGVEITDPTKFSRNVKSSFLVSGRVAIFLSGCFWLHLSSSPGSPGCTLLLRGFNTFLLG